MNRFLSHLVVSIFIPLTLAFPLVAQDAPPATKPALYTLDGDDITIESDESGARRLQAQGNVLLTYSFDGDVWVLSAGFIEYIERSEILEGQERFAEQRAVAEGNIELEGPGLSLAAPGSITVDLLAKRLESDSNDIHLVFENGELTTDKLEMRAIATEGDSNVVIVDTDERTVAVYDLGGLVNDIELPDEEEEGNLFGSLRFDFRTITVETERTRLTVEDGKPILLECLDRSVVTSASNTLTMPSFRLSFDPPTLTGTGGIDLLIGEETVIEAASLSITYPPDGGMYAELAGGVIYESPAEGVPEQVTIRNPAGTFCADRITIEVNQDGTQRISASGSAMFEIPIGDIIE